MKVINPVKKNWYIIKPSEISINPAFLKIEIPLLPIDFNCYWGQPVHRKNIGLITSLTKVNLFIRLYWIFPRFDSWFIRPAKYIHWPMLLFSYLFLLWEWWQCVCITQSVRHKACLTTWWCSISTIIFKMDPHLGQPYQK